MVLPSVIPRVGCVMRHYKGGLYRVVGHAFHTEDEKALVLYRTATTDDDTVALWARPLDMFTDRVIFGGEVVPRFKVHKPSVRDR